MWGEKSRCSCSVCFSLAGPPPSLVRGARQIPPLLPYKLTPREFARRHAASAASPTLAVCQREASRLWITPAEMSDTVKPLTSFFIEDILSLGDASGIGGKRRSQVTDRCSPWTEEHGTPSQELSPEVTAFRGQKGELLAANPSKRKQRGSALVFQRTFQKIEIFVKNL